MHCASLKALIGDGLVLPPDENGWCRLNFQGGHSAEEMVATALILAELADEGRISMIHDIGKNPRWSDVDYDSIIAERL